MTREYEKEELHRLWQVELDLYRKLAEICKKYGLTFVTGFGTTLGAIRHQGFIPWDDDMDFLMPRKDYEKLIQAAPAELGEKYELLEPRLTPGYVMAFAKLARKDSLFIEETDQELARPYHSGIFIDIFPMDYWPQDSKVRNRRSFHAYCLLRLCSLAAYPNPKLPAGMKGWKRDLALAGCHAVHGFCRLFHLTPVKIYRKYLKIAMKTTSQEAEGYVTDLCWCWIGHGKTRGKMVGLQYRYADLFVPLFVPFENVTVPVPEKYDSYLTIAYRNYMQLPPEDKRHCHFPSRLILPEKI